jgi:cation transporter-like permease
MPNASSLSSGACRESTAPCNQFQRRLLVCLVQTLLNVIVIVRFAGSLYQATSGEPFQQIGVTLLLVVLLSSLGRMWFLTLMSRAQ